VYGLLAKELEGPFDLTIVHQDPINLELSQIARKATDFAVGWSMWESTTLSNMDYTAQCNARERFRNLDLMLGYDLVSVGAFRPYVPRAKLSQLQGGSDPEFWEYQERDWHSERFGFCMNGALHARKNPFSAIRAFRALKMAEPERFAGAELHLKNSVDSMRSVKSQLEDWCPKLRLHYGMWPAETLRSFYQSQHCLLAPSMGEGKNVPALEMQATGGLVIATNFGGHTVWQNPAYTHLLKWEDCAMDEAHPKSRAAKADEQHLAELMWDAYTNREKSRQMANLAAQVIPQACSWDSVVERLFLKIKEYRPEVFYKAMACRRSDTSDGLT